MKFLLSLLVLTSVSAFAADKKIASYSYEDKEFKSECAVFQTEEGLRLTHWVAYSGIEHTDTIHYVRDLYHFVELQKEIVNEEYESQENVSTYQAQYTAFDEGVTTPVYGTGKISYHSKSPYTERFVGTIDALCSLFAEQ